VQYLQLANTINNHNNNNNNSTDNDNNNNKIKVNIRLATVSDVARMFNTLCAASASVASVAMAVDKDECSIEQVRPVTDCAAIKRCTFVADILAQQFQSILQQSHNNNNSNSNSNSNSNNNNNSAAESDVCTALGRAHF
jgi:hypothetical protein